MQNFSSAHYEGRQRQPADVIYVARELPTEPFLRNKVMAGQEGKNVHLAEMRDILAPDCNICHCHILAPQIDVD